MSKSSKLHENNPTANNSNKLDNEYVITRYRKEKYNQTPSKIILRISNPMGASIHVVPHGIETVGAQSNFTECIWKGALVSKDYPLFLKKVIK